MSNQMPLRAALGGWITPAPVGIVQMAALLAVVGVAVRIVPQNPSRHAALPGADVGDPRRDRARAQRLARRRRAVPGPGADGARAGHQLMYGGLSMLVVRDVLVLLAWLALALLATSRAARAQRIWTVQRVKPELAL